SVADQQLFIDRTASGKTNFQAGFPGRHVAPLPIRDGQLNLQILLDVSSVEVFANGGRTVMTDLFFPNGDFTKIEISSQGPATLKESRIYPLESIWN
ncbi:MAG: GH32 C-terminal domain-containing protein, partial [Ferruginibacter sp.]|nr:GH32 C-terminal domain-containing protein [Cytophagales bacterium]